MAGVHFKDYNTILEVFKNKKLPYFVLTEMNGKSLLEKNDKESDFEQAEDLLTQILERLASREGGSKAAFQLRLYETLPPGGRITLKTDYDFAYNFTLQAWEESGHVGYNNSQMSRLLAQQERILSKLEGTGEEEEEENAGNVSGLGKTVDKLLANEALAPALGKIAEGAADRILLFLDSFMKPKQQLTNGGGAIAGIPQDATKPFEGSEEEKVQYAIEILKQRVPNLGDTLMKIARMNDIKLNYALSML